MRIEHEIFMCQSRVELVIHLTVPHHTTPYNQVFFLQNKPKLIEINKMHKTETSSK